MSQAVEQVITGLEQGRLTRREAVASLTTLLAAAFAAPQMLAAEKPPASTFRSLGLNHVALRVTDLDRSIAFYGQHVGLEVLRKSSFNTFVDFCRPPLHTMTS